MPPAWMTLLSLSSANSPRLLIDFARMPAIRPGGLFCLFALASLRLSAASGYLGGYGGFGGYGQAFDQVGPYGADSAEFLSYVANSNATGVFKIPGYDVSKPYPGEPMDGWTISLAALDIRSYYKRCSKSGNDPEICNTDSTIAHSMTIQAPDSLLKTEADGTKLVNTDPTWGMCLWDFGFPSQRHKDRYNNQANKPLAADGSCAGFLSDACIEALQNSTRHAFAVSSSTNTSKARYGLLTTCQRLYTPKECGEYGPGNAGTLPLPSYGGVPVKYLNGSVTMTDGWLYENDDSSVKANSTQDLQEFWDSMVLNYWVVVTAMVNATVDANATDAERGAPLAGVHCVAPNGQGTGKGFTFAGTVPANAKNSEGRDGGDEDSGAGLVTSPVGWGVWAMVGVSVVMGWAW